LLTNILHFFARVSESEMPDLSSGFQRCHKSVLPVCKSGRDQPGVKSLLFIWDIEIIKS